MDFRIKCLLQSIFSSLPKGEWMNYGFQKHITRSLPPSDSEFLMKIEEAFVHYNNYKSYNQLKKINNTYYEFGAGWTLSIPLSMSLMGFDVWCIDIRKLIIDELILHTIGQFKTNCGHLPFQMEKLQSVDFQKAENIITRLKETLGFSYIAPLDARKTGFAENYFDFISSTATLEHIPHNDILPILNECHRILNHGGILSMIIDYQDHWSYFDKSISIYNFLQYSPDEWKKYNPSLHYQNRLRHRDYMDMIEKTGFKVVKEKPYYPNNSDMQKFCSIKKSSYFSNYSSEELSIKGTEIVLLKP